MSRRHTFDSLLLVSIGKGRKKEKKEKQITNCDYGDMRVSKSPKWPIMCSRWLWFYISYLTSSVSASCHVCRESPAHRYSAAHAFSTPPLPWKGPRSPHGSLSSNWSAHPLAVPKLRPKNHLPCMPRCICLFPKWCWSVWSALCIICICICIFCINAPPERELELERVWHPMKSCSSKSPKKLKSGSLSSGIWRFRCLWLFLVVLKGFDSKKASAPGPSRTLWRLRIFSPKEIPNRPNHPRVTRVRPDGASETVCNLSVREHVFFTFRGYQDGQGFEFWVSIALEKKKLKLMTLSSAVDVVMWMLRHLRLACVK